MAQNNMDTMAINKKDVTSMNTKYFAYVLNNEVVDAYETMVETALLFVKSQKPPFEKYIKMNELTWEALQVLEKLHLQIKTDMFEDGMIESPSKIDSGQKQKSKRSVSK